MNTIADALHGMEKTRVPSIGVVAHPDCVDPDLREVLFPEGDWREALTLAEQVGGFLVVAGAPWRADQGVFAVVVKEVECLPDFALMANQRMAEVGATATTWIVLLRDPTAVHQALALASATEGTA